MDGLAGSDRVTTATDPQRLVTPTVLPAVIGWSSRPKRITMHRTPLFQTGLRGLMFAGALCAAPLAAQAAAVALTALEDLTTNAGPGVNVMTTYPPTGGDFFRSSNDADSSIFFHTYGFTSGLTYFGARVSGEGAQFFGQTSARYSDSYTNLSGAAQLVAFNFNVDQGQIVLSGTGTGHADLRLTVKFNGGVVAQDRGRIDGAGCDVTTGGVGTLASYLACGTATSASGAGGAYSISQLLAAGDTLNIDYEILAEVSGLFTGGGETQCSSPPNQPGRGANTAVIGEPGDVPGYSGCQFFNAMARSGDPAGVQGHGPGLFNITAANVPEPGSLALAGLALAGLFAARRRVA